MPLTDLDGVSPRGGSAVSKYIAMGMLSWAKSLIFLCVLSRKQRDGVQPARNGGADRIAQCVSSSDTQTKFNEIKGLNVP